MGTEAAAAAGMHCIVRPSIPGSITGNAAMRVVNDWNEVSIPDPSLVFLALQP